MSITVNRITNANVYMNGSSFAGQASEIELPGLQQVMTEHNGLGMIGAFNLPAGLDVFEGSITWNSFYDAAWRAMADTSQMTQLAVRKAVDTYDSAGRQQTRKLVATLNVMFTNVGLGTFSARENAEYPSDFEAYSITLAFDGTNVVRIDKFSNTYEVYDKDLMAEMNRILGV